MSQDSPSENHSSTNTPAADAPASPAGVSVLPPEPTLPSSSTNTDPVSQAPGAAPSSESTSGEPRVDRRQRNASFGGVDQRKNVVDRRTGLDRRVIDMGAPTGLERRRGPGRRRTDDRRSAEEGEMSDEQFEFIMAVDTYKRLNNRPFPTWTEVLEVVKQLGYRKVAASTIKLPNDNGRSTQS